MRDAKTIFALNQRQLHLLFIVLAGLNLAVLGCSASSIGPATLPTLFTVFLMMSLQFLTTPSHEFMAEIVDLAVRPVPQDVLLYGDIIQKAKQPKWRFNQSPLFSGRIRFVAALVIWGLLTYIFKDHLPSNKTIFLTGLMSAWILSAPKLYRLTPPMGFTVILVAIITDHHVFTALSGMTFLTFLIARRLGFVTQTQQKLGLKFPEFRRQTTGICALFCISFAILAFLIPDKNITAELKKAKSKIAQKAAQQLGNAMQTANDQWGHQQHGSPPGPSKLDLENLKNLAERELSPEELDKLDQRLSELSDELQKSKFESEQLAKAIAKGSVTSPDTTEGAGNGKGDGNGAAISVAEQIDHLKEKVAHQKFNQTQKQVTEKKKFEFRLDKFESLARILISIFGIAFVFYLLNQKPSREVTDRAQKRRLSQKRKLGLEAIREFRRRKYTHQRDEVIAAYHTYLAILSMAGLEKQPQQTPNQFLAETQKLDTPLVGIGKPLTQYFNSVYYGDENLTSDQYLEFKQLAKVLR